MQRGRSFFNGLTTKLLFNYRQTSIKYIIDLIWMDVQGAELDVLQGATEILKRTKMVSIEFHESQYCGASSAKDIRDLLLPYGFTETVIAGDRSVFIHD